MAQATQQTVQSSVLSRSFDASVPRLSEDVSSLLHWGRHVLQQQREQRRRPSRADARAVMDNSLTSPSLKSENTYRSNANNEQPQFTTAHDMASSSFLVVPPLHTQQSVQELQARLAQLKAVDADNTRVFERRWSLLQQGRDRVARLHDPVAAAEREQYVATLTSSVQAIVEGEAIVCDTLQGVADRLAQFQQTQRGAAVSLSPVRSPGPGSASSLSSSTMRVASAEKKTRSANDENGEQEEEEENELTTLVRVIRQRAEDIVRTHTRLQEHKAEKEKRARLLLRQRADDVERLKMQLQRMRIDVERMTEKEQQLQETLADAKAQRAAEAHARALQKATESRQRALHEGLQRIQRLQEEATLRHVVARQELAASEARFKETRVVYDMAVREDEAAEEALHDARRRHRHVQQRKQDAEAEAEGLREAMVAMERQCGELRMQRRACEDDSEELQKAMRDRQRRRQQQQQRRRFTSGKDDWSFSSVAPGVSASDSVGGGDDDCDYDPDERLAALQRELPALAAQLKTLEEEEASVQREVDLLKDRLRQERAEVAALQQQKTILETYLVAEPPPPLLQ